MDKTVLIVVIVLVASITYMVGYQFGVAEGLEAAKLWRTAAERWEEAANKWKRLAEKQLAERKK